MSRSSRRHRHRSRSKKRTTPQHWSADLPGGGPNADKWDNNIVDEPWLPDQIEEFDRELYRWFAEHEHGPLDRILPVLSEAANNSKMWLAISSMFYLFGGKHGKETALRAVVALGLTSAIANLVVKRLPRQRPPQHEIPEERMVKLPTSSSFPSGHSASAAAFTAVVAHGEPVWLLPISTLAAGVAFSRIHTGVHYPSDVIAGTALGLLIGSGICAVKPVE